MSETDRGRSARRPERRDPEPSTRELIDSAVRKIVTAVVIAGSVIALGIYSRPGPPRYQAFASEGQIVRIDTRSGTVIACEGRECMRIVQRGQRLKQSLPSMSPKQGTQGQPALPSPSPATPPARQ